MTAKQLTDSILQLAIQGKLVPQDPHDEPASVLLERIREEKRRLVEEKVLKKKDLEEIPVSEEEELYDIPDSWAWVKFFSVFQLETNLVSPNNYLDYPHIAPDNIEKGTGRLIEYRTVMEDKVISNNHLFHKGQIIYSKIRPLLRKAIIAPFDGLCSADMYPLSTSLSVKFALCYLLSDVFNKQVSDICSSRVKMPKININELSSILIPVPPLAEQHRIVQRIEEILPFVKEYGEAYEEASKMDAELPDKLKKSILQEAIMGKLGTQDSEDEPASVLMEQIREEKKRLVKEGVLKKKDLDETPVDEEEEPFMIPKSWMWVRFGDMVSTFTGKTPARGEMKYWAKDDYPWVSISDMQQGAVIDKTKESISQAASDECFRGQISKRGTLLMSFKLTVGRTSILGINAFHNEAIISINTFADADNYTRDYLAYILPIIANLGDSKDAIKGKTLNSKSIYNLFVPLPPYVEQHRIVQRINELYAEIDNMTINNNNETDIEKQKNKNYQL